MQVYIGSGILIAMLAVGPACAQGASPAAGATTPAAKADTEVIQTEVERTGRMGRDVIFATYLTLSKDCRVGASPRVEFPVPPKTGKVGTRTSAINLRAVPGAPRKNCIGTSPNGVLVFFRPERRFKGEETFTYRVVYPDGATREVQAKAIVQ